MRVTANREGGEGAEAARCTGLGQAAIGTGGLWCVSVRACVCACVRA